ncbi:8-amino-7-oxononanoate synthase [Peribacillus asahii]|uniref:8-amino-7-ketopelargonate synthase n=1 Tax=Peribacillus asahii TaxID=228899 RepID=A0A3Q9RM15_9BACI|nr:8-amino-7-oxononanoate synthase [Peribacillus asahii]AZV42599.1 8-amino-7-oxononanoate synthase [Peribacillus asahii]USK86872.1 8-amino-7-oxononanoate synthase [Peribacillus asahii]
MTDYLNQELQQIREQGLFRTLRRIDAASDTETVLEGKKILLFSSNNYLGLANDSRMKEKAIEAIKQFGTGSGGSRLTTGNLSLHEQLERDIASFKGKEASLVFSSGFLANVGIISTLMKQGDVILSDSLNHASIIDGCRLSKADTVIYNHVDMNDLEKKLQSVTSYQRKLIVTDGVFSMDGNIAPLPAIVLLAKKYGAMVMVDDAHSTGILGKTGAGTAEYFGLTQQIDLLMGTLSKSIGAEGGYVAASQSLIQYLRNKARSFIFQTALSPSVVAASIEGIRIIREERERSVRLLENAEFLRNGLKKSGFTLVDGSTPILAVLIGSAQDAVRFSKRLEEEGIFAPAIRPPTVPKGMSRIRLTIMATHQQEQLEYALHTFVKIGKEMNLLSTKNVIQSK